jgi:phosphatidylglycerophosphate synthase
VLGASIAALIRSQIISLIGVLIWLFAIEPILLLLFPDQGKFFLQGLITAIMALDVESEQFNLNTADFADPLTATLLLLGYAAVFAILSMIVSIRRDVE